MKNIHSFSLLLLISLILHTDFSVKAQSTSQVEPCGTMHVLKTAEQKDPYLAKRRQAIEQKIQAFLQNPSAQKKKAIEGVIQYQ